MRDRQPPLIRNMEALGFNLQQEAVLQTLTADVLKSSEIEGEKLDATRRYDQPLTAKKIVRLARFALPHGPQRNDRPHGGRLAR